MMKRLSSRNHRSRVIRVKHVLQIILLLGVCFWLIYQVKHNQDKKKEFDENDAKLPVRTQADQILKLGRKDLHPVMDEVSQNKRHEEEEEDKNNVEDEENKHDHDEEEEDVGNKHETDESEDNMHETEESKDNRHEERDQMEEENKFGGEEQDEDENKSEEIEDEGREGGDNEIDENDQQKTEVDADLDEEFMDEEKERGEVDETEDENSEDEKKGGLVENHNTHEAREEQYKGDDASSAVAHDAHTTSTETETFSLENSDVNLEMNITKPENGTTYSDESNSNENDLDLKVTEGELTDRTSLNATSGEEAGNNSLSNPVDSSSLNKTVATNSDSHLEESSNMTIVITEASNNMSDAGANTSNSSQQNKTVISSESEHAQNAAVNTTITGGVKNVQTEGLGQSGNRASEENLPDSDSKTADKTENRDAAAGESSNLGAGELEETRRSVTSNQTEKDSRNESIDASDSDKSTGNSETSETVETQNINTTEDEMFKGDTQTGETDEMSDTSSANGTLDSVEHDAIDSSDAHMHEEMTKFRTDLDTLPDFRNGVENGDEIAAE